MPANRDQRAPVRGSIAWGASGCGSQQHSWSLVAAFPYYSGAVANFLLSDSNVTASPARWANALQHVSFAVRGMYCQACAKSVETKLMNLSGVWKASVSYETSQVEVAYDADTVTVEQLEKAIQDAGYQAQKM